MSKTLRELTLATVTVTGDLYHISGADLLDKRITIDDISTAVRSTLKGALVADGNVTIETGGLLLARANEDVIQEIGRVKVWGASDVAYVSHYDFATAAGACLQQNNSGDAYLNAPTGRTAGIRIANANILTATGTLITATKPITIAGNITQTAGVTSLKATTVTGNFLSDGYASLASANPTMTGALFSSLMSTNLSQVDSGIAYASVMSSERVLNSENHSLAMGYGSSGVASATNITLHLFSRYTLDNGYGAGVSLYAKGSGIFTGAFTCATSLTVTSILTATSTAISLLQPTTIGSGSANPFNIYRASSGSLFTVTQKYDLWNSASAQTTYASTSAKIVTNTAGAHAGSFQINAYLAGAIVESAVFAGDAIELKKPTTITGLLTANTGISTTGALACATINTGLGAFEIGQSVLTTSNVSFGTGTFTGALSCATIDTGLGAFEIGQNLTTNSEVNFNNITSSNVIRARFNTGLLFPATEAAYFDALQLWSLSTGEWVGGSGVLEAGTGATSGYIIGVTKTSSTSYTVKFVARLSTSISDYVINQGSPTAMNMFFSGSVNL